MIDVEMEVGKKKERERIAAKKKKWKTIHPAARFSIPRFTECRAQ